MTEYEKAKKFFEDLKLDCVFSIKKVKGPVKLRVRNTLVERYLREKPLPLVKIGRTYENN